MFSQFNNKDRKNFQAELFMTASNNERGRLELTPFKVTVPLIILNYRDCPAFNPVKKVKYNKNQTLLEGIFALADLDLMQNQSF